MKETPPSEPKQLSVEDLKAAQEQHEAEIAASKKAEEEERIRKEKLQTRAGEQYEERGAALEEMGLSQAEVDKFKAERIEERIANAEKLREGEEAKEEELRRASAELAKIGKDLEGVRALISGKSEEEIAPQVKAVLQELIGKNAGAEREAGGLAKELERIKAGQVSGEEVERYRKLQEHIEALNTQVAEIEGNPFVIGRLFEEAKTEHAIRESVVGEANYGVSGGRDRREFIEEVCQKFLGEEFAARGVDQIKDPKEREKIMRELAREVATGVGGGVDSSGLQWRLRREPTENERIGAVLKNLLGTEGTLAGTATFFKNAVGEKTSPLTKKEGLNTYTFAKYDAEKTRDAVHDLIGRHLGTLNFVRSRALGTRMHQGNVMGGDHRFRDGDWSVFRDGVSKYGFSFAEEGPILPREADPSVIKNTKEKFQKDKDGAQNLEQKMTSEEKEELNQEISRLEKYLQELQSSFDKAEGAEEDMKKYASELRVHGGPESGKAWIKRIDGEISEAKRRLSEFQAERSNLGILSFGKKRETDERIASEERLISTKNAEKAKLEKDVKAHTDAENILRQEGQSYKIQDKINDVKQNLGRKKSRLQVLG